MSILHYNLGQVDTASIGLGPAPALSPYVNEYEDRSKRDCAIDLKNGIDMIFDLKKKIDKLHPVATEVIIRMLSI